METLNFNYNYVICGSSGYFLYGYHDVMKHPQVTYLSSRDIGFNSFWSKALLRLNFSKKVNKYISTPFGFYCNPRMYPYHFETKKPICFLFFRNHEDVYGRGYISYLREKNPDCKVVLYLQDLVRLKTNFIFEEIEDLFDLIISYDSLDAKNFNLLYHPTPMSNIVVEEDVNLNHNDMYFCGYAKNRYDMIVDIYNICVKSGLRCDFNIMNLPCDAQKVKGIHYHSKPFTYIQNLQHVQKAKCILEIMQKEAVGYTPRLWESIIYDRHILSNNTSLKHSPYSNLCGLHVFENLNNIDIKKWINEPVSYSQSVKNALSPLQLLSFIDKHLSEKL